MSLGIASSRVFGFVFVEHWIFFALIASLRVVLEGAKVKALDTLCVIFEAVAFWLLDWPYKYKSVLFRPELEDAPMTQSRSYNIAAPASIA